MPAPVPTIDDPPRPPAAGAGQGRRVSLLLLGFFLGLLLLGIALDEPARVLEQARAICLECIGIG